MGKLKLYINSPRIIGPVTAVRDARNAVTGSTVEVRKVPLVMRSLYHSQSLCFMF